VGGSERHYGGGEQKFIISFEGSQALPVCPNKCKLLTGTVEFLIFVVGVGGGVGGLTGCVRRKF
jgi:hypothetical protein